MKRATLTPAYGRDYKSKKAAIVDFDADKDFVLNDITSRWDGAYINKSQAVDVYDEVNIRYKRMTQVAVVRLSR